MAVETPNRLLAVALFAPIPAPPFIEQMIASKGVRSFTRSGAGQYIVQLEQPLSFHEGYAQLVPPANAQLVMGSQVLADGTVLVTALTLGTGVPVDPSWFGFSVVLWNEGQGVGVEVPAPPIPPPIPSGGGITPTEHELLRQLIHLADNTAGGPWDGWPSGSFREILPPGAIKPTSLIWWTDATKTKKIVQKLIAYDVNSQPSVIAWSVYQPDGVTVIATVTDTITYINKVFESTRTRTVT